ncbi:thiol:disulfide interchange protein DsbG [Salinisphaera hydrothermalis]|uniref:thiol:disulfide interchange protein DsbG n=1 Tax=Salinisphaera hydrothermalis TaxID=563188 RepID=UPI00333F1F2F
MTTAVFKRLAALAGVGLLATTIAASAQPTKKPVASDLPPVLAKAVKNGSIEVTRQFKTDVPGVTGYVLQKGGQHQIVYGEKGYLFMGQLVSPSGENLSAQYTDKYVPKPDVAKVVAELKKTGHLVQQGPSDAPVIYVFADPNCIYCHRFYQQAEPLVKAGKLQLQWAMVGFLKESSMGRAAAILSAKDPGKALVENENGFDEDTEDGGIKPVDSPSDKLKDIINVHYKQMSAAGGTGTPTLLYKHDGHWAAKIGAPGKAWLKQYIDNQGS